MSKSVSFKSIAIKCHLRALHFHKPFLLLGMGTTVHILKTDSNGINKLLLTKKIFETFNINGIKTIVNNKSEQNLNNESVFKVVFHGNRFLTIYELQYNDVTDSLSLNQLITNHNFDDWIIDVRISEDIVFIVKAHNEVIVFNYITNKIITKVQGNDNCILYSASLVWSSLSPTAFVLVSGTVFKEIVIWSSFEANSQMSSKSLQRLKGHDGVIFAIDYNQELNLLVSASDDRSVRIWTANNCSNNSFHSIDFWNNNEFLLSHIFYGHLARIWSVFTISKPYPIVISVGEDSSLCFWNINEKRLVQKVDGHKNSSIWSLALDSQSLIAYSGGSDGSLSCCDVINTITPFKSIVKHNLDPKEVLFIKGSSLKLFCSTISGKQLIMSAFDDIESDIESELFNNDMTNIFKTYCCVDVNEERNKILLGSKCGSIAIIVIKNKVENLYEISVKKVHNGKVFSVSFVNSNNFISCTNDGIVYVWNLHEFSQIGETLLPNSKHRWPVAGLLYQQMLVIGDRCGSLFAYSMSSLIPTQEYRNIHGRNGVTAIKLKPKTNFMYSSGRNGRIFEFILEDNNCTLLRTFRIFTDMEWIGNFQFDDISGDICYIYGFESRNFVVWDERREQFIYSIECGGGHRSWDFVIFENELYFCYTKHDQLICFNKQLAKINYSNQERVSYLTKTSHSKKINCCANLFFENFNSRVLYFATGGEDNLININSLDTQTNIFKVESVLSGHISNITAINECCAQLYSTYYMVSVGGRSQLIIWKIELKDQIVISKQVINNFLWGSDCCRQKVRKNQNSLQSDPQIRYLDANISKSSEHKYLISTACSDSAFRLFIFDELSLSFQLVGITSFNSSCLLKVFNIFTSHIITASNDGTLKIWSLFDHLFQNLTLNPLVDNYTNMSSVFEMRLHESGINALDVKHINEHLWLIASGGDDNTLVLSLLKSSENKFSRMAYIEESYVHSSQITGIKIIADEIVISVSIDQRIIIWKYDINCEPFSLNIEPFASYISCIADISSFCSVFESDKNVNNLQLIVCGEGFEAIKCSLKQH